MYKRCVDCRNHSCTKLIGYDMLDGTRKEFDCRTCTRWENGTKILQYGLDKKEAYRFNNCKQFWRKEK